MFDKFLNEFYQEVTPRLGVVVETNATRSGFALKFDPERGEFGRWTRSKRRAKDNDVLVDDVTESRHSVR